MRIHADPDPQHWFQIMEVMASINRDTMAKACRRAFNRIDAVEDDRRLLSQIGKIINT
jgi:hypothetical protein